MKNWRFPILAGLLIALGAWQLTLIAAPYALMRAAMHRLGRAAPANVFRHGPPTTAENQTIVRPSPDLLYSICQFDLTNGPVAIDVPPVAGQYWSLSLFDTRTDVIAVRSDRDTGGKPARLALVAPGQSAPAGYKAIRYTQRRGLALIRILVTDRAALPAIDAIRKTARCASIP